MFILLERTKVKRKSFDSVLYSGDCQNEFSLAQWQKRQEYHRPQKPIVDGETVTVIFLVDNGDSMKRREEQPTWVKDVAWFHYSQAYDALPQAIKERFPKMVYGAHANGYNEHLDGIKLIRWIESERTL